MDLADASGTIIAAALTLIGVAVQVARSRGTRTRSVIKADLELLASLRQDSQAYTDLQRHVEARVAALIEHEQAARREPYGIVWGVLFCGAAVASTAAAGMNGGWAWLLMILAVPLAVFGIFALATSIPKRARDEEGQQIEQASQGT